MNVKDPFGWPLDQLMSQNKADRKVLTSKAEVAEALRELGVDSDEVISSIEEIIDMYGISEDRPAVCTVVPGIGALVEPMTGETLAEYRAAQQHKATAVGVNPKDALGQAKVNPSVIPPAGILHLAAAMMDGANKYGPFNWRDNAVQSMVYVAAAQRHLLQFLDGENVDPVSRVHHLGHAMACCAIVLDALETGNLVDTRPKAGAAGDMIRRWTSDSKFNG